MTDDKWQAQARAALRFPRPCKCFERDTIAPLPQCRDGLCNDAVRSIAAALKAAVDGEQDRCIMKALLEKDKYWIGADDRYVAGYRSAAKHIIDAIRSRT